MHIPCGRTLLFGPVHRGVGLRLPVLPFHPVADRHSSHPVSGCPFPSLLDHWGPACWASPALPPQQVLCVTAVQHTSCVCCLDVCGHSAPGGCVPLVTSHSPSVPGVQAGVEPCSFYFCPLPTPRLLVASGTVTCSRGLNMTAHTSPGFVHGEGGHI